MSERLRFAVVLALAWGFVVAALIAMAALVAADLNDAERALLSPLVREHVASVVAIAVLLVFPLALILSPLYRRYVTAAAQLDEDARIMLAANPGHRAPPRGAVEIRRLTETINRFAEDTASMREDFSRRVAEANDRIEQERRRLAALMSELAQSVVVCNIEGRILLYNARSMQLLRLPLDPLAATGKAHSLVGLGRSIFAIFDRNLILHALERVHDGLRHGVRGPVASFVTTTPAGHLVRAQLAPVQGADAHTAGEAAKEVSGFVLVLDNITRRIETGNRRDSLLQTLTQGTRASLASMRAAIETIASFPEMDQPARDRFVAIIGEEAQRLSAKLDATVGEFADSLRTEWPLEEMRGADLIAAARRRIEARIGIPTKLETVDESIWINVDSFSLMQAFCYLAARLREEFGVREIRFALQTEGALAHLDLIWTGALLGTETTMAWQTDSLESGGESSPLTLKQIVERHDGEIWYQIDKPSQRMYFRTAIPTAKPEESGWSLPQTGGSRPEFYDFDLFDQAGQSPELDERELAALSYTVFDTETTGLAPSRGDEIVSIGAVRIVNGRLLDHEVFEQLVDPRREMSPEASRITGIDAAMLANQPTIERVLPAFHTFCADAVLVAHNAAFDMRFLRLKEAASGVRFTQPVLDTLLLSAVVHPQLEVHGLDAIAERMGVSVMGRHTALGDAIMTGEIFLRLIPLLAEHGIRTLGEARKASQETYLARVEY